MPIVSRARSLIAAACVLVAAAACEDEVPTITGLDLVGEQPVSVELLLPASAFVRSDTVFTDFATVREAGYLLVAERFDGVLDAHALATPTGFPDSIIFEGATDSTFRYGSATVLMPVDTLATPRGPVTLRLWSLAQAWDPATVTWTEARAGERWRVPGGTPGGLLGEATWVPGDTAQKDTLRWVIDAPTVEALASGAIPGLLVTAATPGARVELRRMSLAVDLRPSARPDTTLTRFIIAGPQAFIFSPDVPPRVSGWRVGGATADRVVFSADFRQSVPSCAGGVVSPACPLVPLSDVSLHRATILLDPLPTERGFRPTVRSDLTTRRVLEPELGRRSPLAELLTADTVPALAFAASGAAPVEIDITQAVRIFAADSTDATLALLAEPEAGNFAFLRFSDAPRLRLVYTIARRPRLP